MSINNKRELWIARACTLATVTAFAGLFHFLFLHAYSAYTGHHPHAFIKTILFAGAMFFMAYGNLLYQLCLIGYYKRKAKHRPAARADIEAIYGSDNAPSLSILIPSYKEERSVVWQTLISSALAEYPQKDIVLLIDDPYRPKLLEDMKALEETRLLPVQLQRQFDKPLNRYRSELAAFRERMEDGRAHVGVELNRLSILFEEVAEWLTALTQEVAQGRDQSQLNHIDRFFIDTIIGGPARAHHQRAEHLRLQVGTQDMSMEDILLQYQRLASLFDVRFSSFERKKYANLSHEANKAMNLNSYIGLMGKAWKEVETKNGLMLVECAPSESDFSITAPDFVNTIDADTQMVSDYALRLIHVLQQPGNENVAVIQSPCSTFPGCTSTLERAASAFVDMQFQTHQGLTYWGATFWVGANAMLRFDALRDICEMRTENGYEVAVYIQDRTVIEDTESTVDLVHRGWRLFNYPERLTYSPTPPDFGALLIQRRRWANGHLLILPKLLGYTLRAPKSFALVKEFFMRFHYLLSSASGLLTVLMFCCITFRTQYNTSWFPFTTIPFIILFIRDLKNLGYKATDFLRIYALNLLLVPIIAGGVLKSLEQIVTGRKSPFGRTPKVPGRTAAPALYSFVGLVLPFVCLSYAAVDAMHHHWSVAAFTMLNSLCFFYALVVFMGLKETLEDIAAGVKVTLQHIAVGLEETVQTVREFIFDTQDLQPS